MPNTTNDVFKPYRANYVFSNGDRTSVKVMGHDGKGNAWVVWDKDGFKNMVPLIWTERITDED